MKILVIGNGFVAMPIVQRLEREGHEILIFSRNLRGGYRSNQIVGDIFLFEDFIKTLAWKPQIIIHTAWVTTQTFYTSDPLNVKYAKFTGDLANYIAASDVEHLIVLGSCAEYGIRDAPSTAGVTALNPENIYAEQKVRAFNLASRALSKSSVRLSWARIFQPYGPGQDKNRLIPYLIEAIKNKREIHLFKSSSILDWITTRDIASAISWVIENNTSVEVDIGTTIGYTNIEVLMHLEKLMGNTTQWTRLIDQMTPSNGVSLVGKDSPLFHSGWLPNDNLQNGLEWILNK